MAPQEYYEPTLPTGTPRGFLSFELRVERSLAQPAGRMGLAAHFALVHPQLTQIRSALLLARKLGRILILPPLVCGLDRFWAPHNGTIPGSDTTLPIDPARAARMRNAARAQRAQAHVPAPAGKWEAPHAHNPAACWRRVSERAGDCPSPCAPCCYIYTCTRMRRMCLYMSYKYAHMYSTPIFERLWRQSCEKILPWPDHRGNDHLVP